MKKLKRLFIANRGEIARRIALSARRLGMETVMLSDRHLQPRFLAEVITDFVPIELEDTALYLNGPRLIEIAKASRCDSLHPGFGFLSENAGFALACLQAGLVWVGPGPESIDAMASKARARDVAIKAGVPCTRSINLEEFSENEFSRGAGAAHASVLRLGKEAGYPLLVKAALGGGGKGMRRVNGPSEIAAAVLRCHSEAKSSFGDGSLVIERYIETARHVEVQVFGDMHGQVVVIGDRDCSIQRRHQKIIEEAPAPDLSAATRQEMHAAALSLAKAVNYASAGTVEFLVDWTDVAQASGKPDFYFLEMNTRLQVEHPVTEQVFGLDLVAWQLRVAQGESLSESFRALTPRGHSVEARIYAEDPGQNFFPAAGPVYAFVPATGPGLRWEVGLDPIDEVTTRFDPMIAKLVATGETRETALDQLVDGIRRTVFIGPKSNLTFIRAIAEHDGFRKKAVATNYLEHNQNALNERVDGLVKNAAAVSESVGSAGLPTTFGQLSSLAKATAAIFSAPTAEMATGSNIISESPQLPGKRVRLSRPHAQHSINSVTCDLLSSSSELIQRWVWTDGIASPQLPTSDIATPNTGRKQTQNRRSMAQVDQKTVTAPVPGKVVAIHVKAGDEVNLHQALFVLESMKMEFEVKSLRQGKIARLHVAVGEVVEAGKTLAHWD